MEGGFTSELKMQNLEYGVLPNDKLHSRDYDSQRDGFTTTVFYCNDCEYQRTLSKGHQKTILNSRSNGNHYSLWTKTFTQIGKLSRMTFNVPYFAARFLNYIIYFIAVLSRLLSCWKYSYKRNFLRYVLIYYGVILLSTHSLGEELTFMSQGQGKLLDSFVPVGLGFVYKIPNRTFDCDIERIEVSEGSSRNLPHWLAFDETKQQFAGVPSMKDIGSYEILVVALAKSGSDTGKICGMKAFTIYVSSEDKKPSLTGPVLESVSVGLESSETSPSKSNEHFVCVPGLQAVLATVVISTDIHELGGHKRMGILQAMAQHMNLSFNRVAFFHHDNAHPLISQLENPSIIVSGSGDGRYKKGPKSLLTWKISCGALRLGPTYLTELETNVQDGTISNVLGYPVVGWHVTSGVQKARHRARRAVVAGTPTPTATAILPTQFKNVSTITITSSISLITAFVTPNSTLMPLSSTLQVTPTLSVLMSSTLAVESTRNFTSSIPTTSPTLDTVVITSTPVLSSLNFTTIFESLTSSPTVNVSSQVNSTFISSTVNSTSTSVILSTVFKDTSSFVSSLVTSSVNATSISLSPVLNSTSVLELENSTVFLFNSSSIMTSTVHFITPSPSILLPENSSAIPNSTFSTMLPGTNYSTASLNLTQTASVFTSSAPSSLPINSSAVISVLPPSTAVMSSSVALNSTVFMNQTSTIQPSFQTSSFYPPSPTTTSSLTLNDTNMTSSAVSLMVTNTSVVVMSSLSNTTDKVLKTSVVNSSSVVSVVPTLSTVPIITSVNMSTTGLLSTVMNSSVVDATSHASSLVENTSVLYVTLSMTPNATQEPDISTNISRVLPSTSRVITNTTSFSSVILSTASPSPSTNISRMPLTSTANISSFVYPTPSSELNLTSVTRTIYLTNSSTVDFNTTTLQTTSVNKTIEIKDRNSTVVSDMNTATILPTVTTHTLSFSLLTSTETMNASTGFTPTVELSTTVDLINTSSVLPSFTTVNTTLSPTLSIGTVNSSSTAHMLTSFATVSTFALNSTLHDSIITKRSSVMVNSTVISTLFPSTSLLLPSPMSSRIPSSSVNTSVTNTSGVLRTELVSPTAPVVQNYSSYLMISSTTIIFNITSSILTNIQTSFSRISPTLVTTTMTTIMSTQNDSRSLEQSSTLMILNSTSVLPKESKILISVISSSSMALITSSSRLNNWSSMLTPNATSSSQFRVTQSSTLELPHTTINTSQDVNSTVVSGVPTSSPIFSTSVLPSSTNVTMTTVSPSNVVLETQTPYLTVTPSNASTVPLSSSLPPFLNTSSLAVSSSSVVMETESTVVVETRTPYPTVTPSNTSTVPLSSSPTPVLYTSLPVVTSSVNVSPGFSSSTNYTNDILNVTMTTSLVDETPSPNASSQVLTTATVNSSIVLPSSVSATSTALLTTSLSSEVIPPRSITINTTLITNTSVYLELSTLTSVPSVNVTTPVVIPTTFISPSSSSLLEETTTVLIRNSTTPYFTTTTLLVSSLQPLTSSSVLASNTQVAIQTSRVMNSSAIFSTSVVSITMSSSFIPSSATSLPVSTSLVTSGISTVLAPSSSWVENSTVITPFSSDSPRTSSSSISSIVVSSIEASTVLLTSQILSSSVQPLPTNVTPNTPPQVLNDIGRLTATAGKVFRYQIPEDVFHDEDGYTRKLTLTLKRLNEELIAEELGNNYWLVFNADKQEMYGLPMEKDVPSDPERGVKFRLAARDSAGLIGYDVFEIMISRSSISYTQSLSMRLDNDFNAFERNISQRLDLISRISGYYGDSDTSQVRVLSYSQGSILFSWTNDSLPSDVCNTTQVNYVAERVVGSDGVNLAFKEHLFPEYNVTNANRTLNGVCNTTTLAPPLVPDKVVGTESSGLWEKHVLPGIIVVIILIIIAVVLLLLFIRRRRANPADPEKRTYKKRKPIILEPEMEMKPRSGKPLILENDELSHPPSYMSEISLDKTPYYDSDDYDEEDYKRSSSRSSPVYETPPPEYNVPQGPLEQPPPAYRLPPTFYSLPPWETSSDV